MKSAPHSDGFVLLITQDADVEDAVERGAARQGLRVSVADELTAALHHLGLTLRPTMAVLDSRFEEHLVDEFLAAAARVGVPVILVEPQTWAAELERCFGLSELASPSEDAL